MSHEQLLIQLYQAMYQALGASSWWPAESNFEVCLGAVLTQNTNWSNASRAIEALREQGLLFPDLLAALPEEELAQIIRPAGYYRVKAGRIKNLLDFLRQEADYDLDRLAREPVDALRSRLLGVNGIGQETADSILLYALKQPVFVVDAYTARIMHRHSLVPEDVGYNELQELFTANLPQDVALYNEYHALFVRVGKGWCKKSKPSCSGCPLEMFL